MKQVYQANNKNLLSSLIQHDQTKPKYFTIHLLVPYSLPLLFLPNLFFSLKVISHSAPSHNFIYISSPNSLSNKRLSSRRRQGRLYQPGLAVLTKLTHLPHLFPPPPPTPSATNAIAESAQRTRVYERENNLEFRISSQAFEWLGRGLCHLSTPTPPQLSLYPLKPYQSFKIS